MKALRKIQLLSIGVIVNGAAGLALLSPTAASAATCGDRHVCLPYGYQCTGGAQYYCSNTLPPGCASSTPIFCFNYSGTQCSFSGGIGNSTYIVCRDQ